MAGGFQSIGKIPELQRRILFAAAMLAIYRVGCAVPVPGVDSEAIRAFFRSAAAGFFGLFNLFSGGALENFSLFALGIMPYISASIILQLLTVVVPHLEKLSKEGESGRKKITQYTRYGTVVLAVIQGLMISTAIQRGDLSGGEQVVYNPGWAFKLMTVITLAAGTAFLMWLGEQITERGIGNGISLIIFSGIVVRIPSGIQGLYRQFRQDEIQLYLLLLLLIVIVGTVGAVVFMERAQRRIPVQYAKRIVGRRVLGGRSIYWPIKVNTAGVIPPIFASSMLLFPMTIASFYQSNTLDTVQTFLSPGGVIYNVVYVALIIFFCYFYTAVMINPVDVADNIKKYGGYIPGIRPGKNTANHINRVLVRITLVGAIYVAAVCVLPVLIGKGFSLTQVIYFGGTSLLIVVGVALDTVSQIESHLIARQYEGFLKSGRVRGRR